MTYSYSLSLYPALSIFTYKSGVMCRKHPVICCTLTFAFAAQYSEVNMEVRSRGSSSLSAATLQEEKPRTDQKAVKSKTNKKKATRGILALLLIALVVLTL